MAGTTVGQLELDLILQSDGFKNQLQTAVNNAVTQTSTGMASTVGSMFGKLGKVALAAFSVKAITGFIKETTELGSTLQEVQNVVDVTFTTMSDQVNDFASKAMKQFGLSEAVTKKYVGTMGAMAKSFGFTEQEAYKMSTTLTGLVGDVASFYNLDSDTAYTKLKAVFTGETEALKDLGVVMTQAALDQFALAEGYGKTTAKMSEQEKVALRYAFVQDQLATATGDFIRTQGSWANQTKILSMQWNSFKANIGQAFISVLTPMIQYLNLFIEKIVEASARFKNFVQSIFGVQEASNSTGDMAEQVDGMTSSMDTATSSAKKLRKSLMGFDNLNVLSSNDTGASTSGSVGVGETKTEEKNDTGYKGLFNLKEALANIDLGEIGKKLSNWITDGFNALTNKINEIDWANVGTQIGNFLAAIDWKSILESIGKAIWEAINAGVEIWKSMFDAAPVETAILTAIALLKFTGIGSLIWEAIKKALLTKLGAENGAGLGAALWNWFKNGISGIGTKIATWLTNTFGSVGAGLGGIGLIIGGLITGVTSFIDMFKNGFSWLKEILMVFGIALAAVGAIILGAPALIAGVIAAIVAAIATAVIVIKDNWESVKTFFIETWDKITTGFKNTFPGLTEGFTTLVDNVKGIFQGLWDMIAGLFTGDWERLWEGVKSTFSNWVKGIGNIFIGWVNGIIDAINLVIKGLNKIKLPDALGGAGININPIANVPYLANGGYVKPNTPQLAVIGDNRHQGEVVAPEGKISEAVSVGLTPILAVLQQLANAMAGNGQGSTGDIVIPIYLDGSLIDERIVTAQDRRTLRSGGLA